MGCATCSVDGLCSRIVSVRRAAGCWLWVLSEAMVRDNLLGLGAGHDTTKIRQRRFSSAGREACVVTDDLNGSWIRETCVGT